MQNKLSTKLVTLDLDVILANYRRPEFWKKTWTIFDRPQYKITANIIKINIEDNEIVLKLKRPRTNYDLPKAKKHAYCSGDYEYVRIPIDHPEYTKENFKRQVTSRCLTLLEGLEKSLIHEYSDYEHARDIERQETGVLRRIAEDFLDRNNISNEHIRYAYKEAYINENAVNNLLSWDICEKYKYKVIGNEYLILLSFLDEKEKFEEFKKECTKVRKSQHVELWKLGQQLDSDEYKEEMTYKLESLYEE